MTENQKLHLVFSHGKEGWPWGTKIKSMADGVKSAFDCELHSLYYRDLNSPEERAERLVKAISGLTGKIILIGSSMGAYASTLASAQVNVDGLLLLAPAFYLPGYQNPQPTTPCQQVTLIHGWGDEVVPYQHSIRFAQEHKASLKLVDDDHRLSADLDLLTRELLLLKQRVDAVHEGESG